MKKKKKEKRHSGGSLSTMSVNMTVMQQQLTAQTQALQNATLALQNAQQHQENDRQHSRMNFDSNLQVKGYMVGSVVAHSPADEAGLAANEVVLEINGKPATQDFVSALVIDLKGCSGKNNNNNNSQGVATSVVMLVLDSARQHTRLIRVVPSSQDGTLGVIWLPYGWGAEMA